MIAITLAQYHNEHDGYTVLEYATVRRPDRITLPLGSSDHDTRRFDNLTGGVDAEGNWLWDGVGSVSDERGNQIDHVAARRVTAEEWRELAGDDSTGDAE